MRISSPLVVAVAVSLIALASCTSTGECVRYTDCDDGFTCAYGRCVVPPASSGDDASTDGAPVDGSLDAAPDAASDASDASDAADALDADAANADADADAADAAPDGDATAD